MFQSKIHKDPLAISSPTVVVHFPRPGLFFFGAQAACLILANKQDLPEAMSCKEARGMKLWSLLLGVNYVCLVSRFNDNTLIS